MSLFETIKARVNDRKVERRFFALTTYGTYTENIILFMLWIFDTRRGFIVHEYLFGFKAMHHEDSLEFKRHEEDKNVINIRKSKPINYRTGI